MHAIYAYTLNMTMPILQQAQRFRARYILDGLDFVEGGALDVVGGQICALHRSQEAAGFDGLLDRSIEVIELGNVALVPGLLNVHSHSFQRAIRGRTEFCDPARPDDDFWTWRERMYDAALSFSPEQIEATAALAFLEMALGGITSVGEFHYVHHQPDGTPYGDPNELAHRIVAAAHSVGIRICLLRVAYARAGFGASLDPRQRRFIEPDCDSYLERFEHLHDHYKGVESTTFGLAPHSIRAVPRDWLDAITSYGANTKFPVHIHACEQRAELLQAQAEYRLSPIELLDEVGLLNARTTIVHATHLTAHDLDLLEKTRPTICACPTTERNLGDGFLPARELNERQIKVALGSDSQTTIDIFEEMRLVEYHERLRHERRNILATRDHDYSTARALWPMATRNGARALDLAAGILAPNHVADFTTLDLNNISLIGATKETLLSALTLSMPASAVRDVYVAGKAVIERGRHPQQDAIIAQYRKRVG